MKGFVYAHTESPLTAYHTLYPEVSIFHPKANINTICKPLLYEPGKSWLYSTSIDFVGKVVERVSGQRLDEYFQRNIFDPLGLKTLSFFPTNEIKEKKMAVCERKPDGSISPFPGGFGMGRPSQVNLISTELLLGGAGLFGTLADYLGILRAVLQSDPSSPHRSDKPLISPESFKELFTGCIQTEAGKKAIVEMVSRPGYFEPPATPANTDHSVGFMLNLEDFTGRRKQGSGSWSGAAKTQFWVDPKTGIAVSSFGLAAKSGLS
jgi:methyl acetate hydrolase